MSIYHTRSAMGHFDLHLGDTWEGAGCFLFRGEKRMSKPSRSDRNSRYWDVYIAAFKEVRHICNFRLGCLIIQSQVVRRWIGVG